MVGGGICGGVVGLRRGGVRAGRRRRDGVVDIGEVFVCVLCVLFGDGWG